MKNSESRVQLDVASAERRFKRRQEELNLLIELGKTSELEIAQLKRTIEYSRESLEMAKKSLFEK